MVARIARTRPQPIVQATASDWSETKRARRASQLLEGEFYRQRFWPKVWPTWIRDACTFGSGLISVQRHRKSVLIDRVLPTELFVDEWDARYGDPRNLYRVRDIDRGIVQALFGYTADGRAKKDVLDTIEKAQRLEDLMAFEDTSSSTVDRITLIQSWHLCDDIEAHAPTASKADREKHKKRCTGRTAFTLTSGDLEVSPWMRGYFPICKLDYTPALVGFFGQGMAEQLEGTQYEINFIEERMQEAFKLVPGLWIFNPGNSVLESHFVNGLGNVIPTTPGMPPTIQNPDPIHPEFFNRQAQLVQSAADDTGQTQQGMQGAKQPGVNAAVAMRELEEQESARHVVFARAAEEGAIEVGRQVLDCIKEIAEEYGDHAVMVPMADGLLPLKWSDCDVEQYTLRVFSSSVLPQSRPARVQTLREWFQDGIIDKQGYMRLLDATDLEGFSDMDTSGDQLLLETLEVMLHHDDPEDPDAYIPPSEFVDPDRAITITMQRIRWAQLRKAPEANVMLLTKHLADYERLKEKAAPPAPPTPDGGMSPGMPPPGGPPPGAPMAPPGAPPPMMP